MPVPFRETGAFEMLAWQFVWVIGLWVGSAQGARRPVQPTPFPRWAVRFALLYALVHFVWRHAIGQAPFPHDPQLSLLYDKWQLGPLRLINFLCLDAAGDALRPALARRLPRLRVLELLGQQSLPVFCAHLVLAMLILVVLRRHRPEAAVVDRPRAAGRLLRRALRWSRGSASSSTARPRPRRRGSRSGARHAGNSERRGRCHRSRRIGERRPDAPRSPDARAHSPPG